MDIFSALIEDHETQRKYCRKINSAKTLEAKKEAYESLRVELKAHAAAEERHLYMSVMNYDEGLDLSRHAISEHHEMDELMSTLSDGRTGESRWLESAEKLTETVEHHLQEEEDKFFKEAKRLLDKEQIERLGALYQTEFEQFKEEAA